MNGAVVDDIVVNAHFACTAVADHPGVLYLHNAKAR